MSCKFFMMHICSFLKTLKSNILAFRILLACILHLHRLTDTPDPGQNESKAPKYSLSHHHQLHINITKRGRLHTCRSCRMKGEMTASKSEFVSTFCITVCILDFLTEYLSDKEIFLLLQYIVLNLCSLLSLFQC